MHETSSIIFPYQKKDVKFGTRKYRVVLEPSWEWSPVLTDDPCRQITSTKNVLKTEQRNITVSRKVN